MTNSIKCVFCGECFVRAVYLVWNEWAYEVHSKQSKNKRTNHPTADSKPSSNQALTTSAETGSPAKAASWSSQLRTLFEAIYGLYFMI